MTSTAPTDVRDRAEAHLRALVGRDDAVLRDDQWTAIEALVVDRRRVAGRAAHRLGQVRGLLRRHRAAARAGRRADGDRLAAAGADAQPDRGRRARRASARSRSTRPTSRTGSRSTDAVAAGEVDVLLVSPERLNNPDFRDEVLPAARRRPAACSWSTRRTASPTGATTSGPTTAGSAPCSPTCPTASRCSPPPPPPTPGSPPTSPSSSGATTSLVLRGTLDRESLRLGVRAAARPPSSGWPGSPTTSPSCPARASSTASPSPPPRRSPTSCAPAGTTSRRTPARPRPTERQALEAGPARQPGQGAGRHLRARHGLRQPTSASWSTWAPRRRRSPTTSRSAAPAAAPTSATVVLLPGAEDRDIWRYFASLAFPPRASWCAGRSRCSPTRAAPMRTAALETARRPPPHPARDDAQGARRRRRRAPGPRRLGRHRPAVGLRRRALRAGRRGPASASSRPCSTTSPPTGCRMRFLRDQLDDPDAPRDVRPLRQLRRPRPVRRRLRARPLERGRRPAGPARGRRSQPRKMWPTALANARRRPQGQDRRRAAEEGRAVARLTDLGHGQALRELFRPDADDGPVPDAAGARRRRGAGRLAPRGRRRSWWSSRRPGPP